MEKWVQLMVAILSLLRVLMEFPETFLRWKERMKKRSGHGKKRTNKRK